ncbi:hypothetical protein KNP414_02340 [Paenibacillus mucilaginosus KNP414]|uniref:Uncharacterized protein n=1 Tax=Paenibacillus mucilaginosus (strain KNP414) TaxID=1036673 RepID=F8F7Z7_PAEMK|nr:hypothetical protein KNP414_02340 [Paenibacillus mucilaginosus KNP414]
MPPGTRLKPASREGPALESGPSTGSGCRRRLQTAGAAVLMEELAPPPGVN